MLFDRPPHWIMDPVHEEAIAHGELMRRVNEYPSRAVTYDMVLDQLNRVRDLNDMMDRDEQMDEGTNIIAY